MVERPPTTPTRSQINVSHAFLPTDQSPSYAGMVSNQADVRLPERVLTQEEAPFSTVRNGAQRTKTK